MKTPIMLACALVLATVLNGRTQEKAATPATPAVPAAPAAVEKDANAGKGKGAKLTPEQVREEAIRKCLEGGPTGYILAAGDMVPPDTSLENVQALVDVAVKSLWRE